MRILMLSTDFLPNIGGIAAHIMGVSAGLSHLGHKVTVVVPSVVNPWSFPWRHEECVQNFRVIRLGVPRLPKLTRIYYAPYVANALRQLIQSDGYEIVHWHTFNHDVIGRLNGLARVFTNHTSQFLEYAANPRERLRAQRIVQPADWVITPSQELAQATITVGYPTGRTCVISNGVDTRRFSPTVDGQAIRRRYDIASDECVVLCPRRLEKKNGVIYWVQAIPLLLRDCSVPIRFMFVGDYQFNDQYSAREEVLAAIAALGLGDQVIFTGAVPNAEMPSYFAAADIVVLPSLMEATSIAGLEAMASGKPIVGTNVGGIPEIVIEGQTGYLAPPADSPALAAAVHRLVASPDLRQTMGHAARSRAVREFDWQAIARKTASLYEEALKLRE